METLTNPHIHIKNACEKVFVSRYQIRDEDVIYNAMASIIESYERGSTSIKNFEAWVIGAIHHSYCDYVFKKNRNKMFVSYDGVVENMSDEKGYDGNYDLELIKSEIDRLDSPYLEIARKKLIEGKSHKEIAKEMNMNEATIRKYYSRSLPKLKKRLKYVTIFVLALLYI